LASYIFKTAALGLARPIFNFYEKDNVISLSNNINLADFGLPIPINNLKTLLLQQFGDGRFGFFALFGSFNS